MDGKNVIDITWDVKRRTCPVCGKEYSEHPATSREDNQTPICPDCGIRQAMKYMGATKKQAERIIEIIHRWKNIHSN